jgi:hypothetical protein
LHARGSGSGSGGFYLKALRRLSVSRLPDPDLVDSSVGDWLSGDPTPADFGRLVAALAAYDRLNDPWQDLLDYYSAKRSPSSDTLKFSRS